MRKGRTKERVKRDAMIPKMSVRKETNKVVRTRERGRKEQNDERRDRAKKRDGDGGMKEGKEVRRQLKQSTGTLDSPN